MKWRAAGVGLGVWLAAATAGAQASPRDEPGTDGTSTALERGPLDLSLGPQVLMATRSTLAQSNFDDVGFAPLFKAGVGFGAQLRLHQHWSVGPRLAASPLGERARDGDVTSSVWQFLAEARYWLLPAEIVTPYAALLAGGMAIHDEYGSLASPESQTNVGPAGGAVLGLEIAFVDALALDLWGGALGAALGGDANQFERSPQYGNIGFWTLGASLTLRPIPASKRRESARR